MNELISSSLSIESNKITELTLPKSSEETKLILDRNKLSEVESENLYKIISVQEDVENQINSAMGFFARLLSQDVLLLKCVIYNTITNALVEKNSRLLGLLFIMLSHTPYEIVKNEMKLITYFIKNEIEHLNSFAVENFIQVFEIWGDSEAMHHLESIDISIEWLSEYKNDVLEGARIKNEDIHSQDK